MIAGTQHLGATGLATAPAPLPRFVTSAPVDVLATLPRADRVELSSDVMPPDLHDAIDSAAERAIELAAQNRELHFARHDHSGRIVVQVRDLDGNVIRTIPHAHALDVMAGAEL